ncbi:hypothetical protein NFI96_006098 [Prochilodus magdalenae]|nr:hypothetical protein NFI96_006098 [Prochilodus magdalenae]
MILVTGRRDQCQCSNTSDDLMMEGVVTCVDSEHSVTPIRNNNDETNDRNEVSRLASWCKHNNHSLNAEKAKETVVDFRRAHTQHTPLSINGAAVERVSSIKLLGVSWTITHHWPGSPISSSTFKKSYSPTHIMCTYYKGAIESILTSCITVWYNSEISFHSFPVDPEVRARWLTQIRRDNFSPLQRMFSEQCTLVTSP